MGARRHESLVVQGTADLTWWRDGLRVLGCGEAGKNAKRGPVGPRWLDSSLPVAGCWVQEETSRSVVIVIVVILTVLVIAVTGFLSVLVATAGECNEGNEKSKHLANGHQCLHGGGVV